jgi:antitoxin component YwqK of YwqJK toxin-antitoxin module
MNVSCDICSSELFQSGIHECYFMKKRYKQIKKIASFMNGKFHGWNLTFNESGQLQEKSFYDHGKLLFTEEYNFHPKSIYGNSINGIQRHTKFKTYSNSISSLDELIASGKDISCLWISSNKAKYGWYVQYNFTENGLIRGIDARYSVRNKENVFFRKFYENGSLMFGYDGDADSVVRRNKDRINEFYKNGNLKKIWDYVPAEAEI